MADGSETYIRPRLNKSWRGIPILIETPKGVTRKGVDEDGTPWASYMYYDYGFIPVADDADGEGLDVYFGPAQSQPIMFT